MAALRLAPEFRGTVGYDKLRSQAMAMKPLPSDPSITEPRQWRDNDDTMLAEWAAGRDDQRELRGRRRGRAGGHI
jgi:hypothetical protein